MKENGNNLLVCSHFYLKSLTQSTDCSVGLAYPDWIVLLCFQIHYNIIVRTGRRTYPRYFKLVFVFHRVAYQSRSRAINPERLEQKAKVVELRSLGWSFPSIAKHLGISVGTAWNMAKVTN